MSEDRDPFDVGQSNTIDELVKGAKGATGKPPGEGRKKPLYQSEIGRRGQKVTYDVGDVVIAAVKEIAIKERVAKNTSKVAQALLAYAIDAYNAGGIVLEVEHEGSEWWLKAVEG